MALDNVQIVRKAYQITEDQDLEGWVAAWTAGPADRSIPERDAPGASQGRPRYGPGGVSADRRPYVG